jgi:hypothetical protein
MSERRWLWLGVLAWAFANAEARAHFLFLHIGPMAEGGRSVEVFFSDQADAGDPKFVEKIAHTQLWIQATPGTFRPLEIHKGADRLRAHVPASDSVAVVGECRYGVIARPNEVPFLLCYYPKAVAGRPEELNQLKPHPGTRMEIIAEVQDDRLLLTTLREGQPMPDAVFHAVAADLTETEIKAGPDGRASWTPPAPGQYALYTRHDIKKSGQVDDKQYEEVREFATLTLDWPLIRSGADAEAVALFQKAIAARASWKDFPGFTARIEGDFDGRPFAGKVAVDSHGTVTLEGVEAVAETWALGQLKSIVLHRLEDSSGEAPVLRFADDRDDHPLGRLLVVEGDEMASSYRIKDQRITSVNRHMGPLDMTIITLDNQTNREGKLLPTSYVVQYWDDATGRLRRVESFEDRWERVGSWDLPSVRTVTTASDAGQSIRGFRLSELRLRSAP